MLLSEGVDARVKERPSFAALRPLSTVFSSSLFGTPKCGQVLSKQSVIGGQFSFTDEIWEVCGFLIGVSIVCEYVSSVLFGLNSPSPGIKGGTLSLLSKEAHKS